MADRTQDKTQSAVGDAKGILKGIKGAGDAIRGTVNESIDTAFNDREGEVKNKAIKERGQSDVLRADEQVGGKTATGPTTATGGPGNAGHTTGIGGTTTGAGAHSGGVGNMSSLPAQNHPDTTTTYANQRF
ncbi:hypothetical protein CLCR_10959 [Cladophialophora carrionii]|uniref:Uncharacterized protein n=1 Tax=Cladophialophora carrionii TaxID=86049 RepID=A0A1C1CZB5_9EURO|nr:hypothetical protein CLCR_10959 [Cladophialophora carrionii]